MGNSSSATTADPRRGISDQFDKLKDNKTGLMTRAGFHTSLELLEQKGLRKMKDSPLGNILFEAFAITRPDALNAAEFQAAIIAAVSASVNDRTEATFKALSGRTGNFVSIAKLVQLMGDSWRFAVHVFVEKRQLTEKNDKDQLTALVCKFAENNYQAIIDTTMADLTRLDPSNTGMLTKAAFMTWLAEDRTVKLVVDSETIEIPTSFTYIQKPSAYPEMRQPVRSQNHAW